MRITSLMAATAAASMVAGVAHAQQGPTPQVVAEWLTNAGLSATLDGVDEEPYVRVQEEQLTWLVLFYGCETGGCDSLQFSAGFSNDGTSLELVNQWNAQRRFLKAYYEPGRDQTGSAIAQYDVIPVPGAPISHLDTHLEVWRGTLADFGVHVGYFIAPE